MHGFLRSNPGLRSRFSREIVFPDYTDEELLSITRGFAAEHEYARGPGAEQALASVFRGAPRGEGFGNARFARALFEQALNMHAVRLTREGLEGPTLEDLRTLTDEDLRAAAGALGEDPPPRRGPAGGIFRRRPSA